MTETHHPVLSEPVASEPTLRDLLLLLWRGKWFVLGGAVIGVLLGVAFLTIATPKYRAQMLVGPASQNTSADLATLLREYDLPNLQYVIKRSGSSESADFVRFEQILTGPAVAALLLEGDAGLAAKIAGDRFSRFSSDEPPETPVQLAEYFTKAVSVEPVGSTSLRKIVYRHPDREFAAALLARMHRAADELIRKDVGENTDARIRYLNGELSKTQHPDHRRAITAIMMEQEQVRMLVNMDQPFAAAVIEAPAASSRPHWPKKSLVLPVAVMVGAFFGFLLFSFRHEP